VGSVDKGYAGVLVSSGQSTRGVHEGKFYAIYFYSLIGNLKFERRVTYGLTIAGQSYFKLKV
jgi:hypothetical protein